MDEERRWKDWLKILLPRVIRAAIWGFIMGGEILIPLLMPGIGGNLESFFPTGQFSFSFLVAVFVGFEVTIQLLRGTIFQYALSIARTLISSITLVLMTNMGIMTLTISPSPGMPLPPGITLIFTVDFKAVLGVFLIFSLLSIIKNLLQAVDFLSQRAEEPVIPPELP